MLLMACEENFEVNEPDVLNQEVLKVQSWYESSMDRTFVQKSGKALFGQKEEVKTPDWEKAIVTDVKGKSFVNLPVRFSNGGLVTSEKANEPLTKNGVPVFRSFLISPNGDGYSLAVINVIPDNPDLIRSENGFVGYFELIENGFSGRMIYTDWSGNFGGGHVFKDGKPVSIIDDLSMEADGEDDGSIAFAANDGGNIDPGGCVTQILTVYERYCYNDFGFVECTEWEPIGTYSWMECDIEYLEEGSGNGGQMAEILTYILLLTILVIG